MTQNKIILFRFHSEYEVCKERIRILNYFNPKIPIYALFGGDKSDWKTVKSIFKSSPIENIQISTNIDKYWKWLHPEQTLREWYGMYGHKLNFDLLFDQEWDVLSAAPLLDIYSDMPNSNEVALTGVESFDRVKDRWRWVMGEEHKIDFIKFQKYIKEAFGISNISNASLGPGQIFTHKFLDDFTSLSLDMSFIDPIVSEIIYPVAAQILKYKVVDTGIYPGWFNREEAIKYFNCWYLPIEEKVISEELNRKNGRRIFHPVKYQFPLEGLINT